MEMFGELRIVVLEENGEDKVIRKSNYWTSFWTYRREETLLNNMLCRKAYSIGHILRRNTFLHDAIEGQMREMKWVGRRTQHIDDLRNRKRYRELKEKAEDQKSWKRQFTNKEIYITVWTC
jgi:hypothetical protein